MLRNTKRSPHLRDLSLPVRSFQSAKSCRGKHKSIDWQNCHYHSQVSSSLTAHLTVRPLSLPRSTMASGRPDVVAAFVDQHTVTHYGMVHKPGGVIHSLVCHIRSVSVRREGPCKFHSRIPSNVLATVRSWI